MMEGWRPRRRADCADVPRPCPFVGCRYHLFLERTVSGHGRQPADLDPLDIPPEQSCALDIADRGAHTLEEVAEALQVTPKGAGVIIERAKRRLRVLQPTLGTTDYGTTCQEFTAAYERP